VLEGSACLAAALGESSRAIRLAGAANHLRRQLSAPLPQVEQTRLDQSLSSAWVALGEPEGKLAWAEGSQMSIAQAVLYAVEEPRFSTSNLQDQ